MPYSTLFPGQEANEKIILVLRRHWWVVFKFVFFYFVLFLLPLLISWLVKNYTTMLDKEFWEAVLGLLASLYYLYTLTFFFRAWVDYYLDVWVVTSERIVNIEQKDLFRRKISTHRLYRVQDVSSEVAGFLPTLFHYGDISVQTAGPNPNFTFKEIPHSYEVTKKIMKLVAWKKQKMMEEGFNPDDAQHE